MSKIPAIVWLPLAFVVGGIVGYYGPAEELRARDARAQEQAEQAKTQQKNAFGSFAQLVNIPDAAKHPRRVRDNEKREKPAKPDSSETPAQANVAETNGTGDVAVEVRRGRRLDPEDLRARIDEAADLWRTRVEIARTAAVEKLGLDEARARAFGEAIDAMNEKLRDSMQFVADEIASAKAMTPELGVRLMGDLSTSLAETYDAIGGCVGEDKRDQVSELQLFDFVDPSVAEPLIAVQDKLDPHAFGGSR